MALGYIAEMGNILGKYLFRPINTASESTGIPKIKNLDCPHGKYPKISSKINIIMSLDRD